MAEVSLELKEIKKSFTEGEAVLDNISLEISKGEFITLLGSSGCGKMCIRDRASTEESEENCAVMAVKEVRDFLENGNIKNLSLIHI